VKRFARWRDAPDNEASSARSGPCRPLLTLGLHQPPGDLVERAGVAVDPNASIVGHSGLRSSAEPACRAGILRLGSAAGVTESD
jgi:hypothetical protein